ncbi:hypothetical protein Ancab_022910 [Ancistrocladus abbreviatus]
MAKRSAAFNRKLTACFFIFITIISVNIHLSGASELDFLLSFKASIVHDPLDSLSNWNTSTVVCTWSGVTCTDDQQHVTKIILPAKNIFGSLSASIFHLPFLDTVDLAGNQLSGRIPNDAFSCLSLHRLNLSDNNFTGQIPNGSIPVLVALDLSNNMLSGKIPENIGGFSCLKHLDLGGNVLVWKIPNSVSNMTSLEYLTLASNQLDGEIPSELGLLTNLKWIYLGYNKFSGKIPEEIGHLSSLNQLDLVYNNLTGQIPFSLGNLTGLQFLFLYQNKLSGPIPKSIFSLKKLMSLDLSDNFLSGEIPELIIQLQSLEILHLFSNNLTGKIPIAISSLPHLQVLQLWSNSFTGQIPPNLGKKNNLTVLDFSTNSLTGKIPEGLCNSGHLLKLILFSNSLEGEIPPTLGHCQSLKRVRLQNNRLSGGLPEGFTTLPLIYFLDLSSNYLLGDIGTMKWNMPLLKMMSLADNKFSGNLPELDSSIQLENLDLSENNFSGNIQANYGKLSQLTQLKLSRNSISGSIPSELSSCKKLVSLDLSSNQLSGPIPGSLGSLPVLGQLDLSKNQLSGLIPEILGSADSLVQINISHNCLYGALPTTGAFLAINWSSVAGNRLCGGDPTTGLPPCKSRKSPFWWSFVACLLVALFLIGLVAYFTVFIHKRKKSLKLKKVENEDGIWELQFFDSKASRAMTIHDIISSKEEESVISIGMQETSYKGRSAMKAMQFVVEEKNHAINSLDLENAWEEASALGKIRHQNIVQLLGFCRSEKGGFLAYESLEGKNLSEVLGGLSWERRRRIVVGVAKALRFLHCRCRPSVSVGELSPERVIVDGEDEAHLRLSVRELLDVEPRRFLSSAYLHPETRKTKELTDKNDVYGLGLILIELLTGRSPADGEFSDHESIVAWAQYCYTNCHLDTWIDPTILGQRSIDQNEMIEAMNLALHCTTIDPSARPCSNEIVKTLESISSTRSFVLAFEPFSSDY